MIRPFASFTLLALAGLASAQTHYAVRNLDALLPAGAAQYGTQVMDVNSAGDFVGNYAFMGGASGTIRAYAPFVYHNGTFNAIPSVASTDPIGAYHTAHAINESGVAVGDYTTDAVHGYQTGFVWKEGVLTDVPGVGTVSDINDAGLAVAWTNYWKDGVVTPIPTLNDDTFPFNSSVAINNNDHVAGACSNWDASYLYDGTGYTLSPDVGTGAITTGMNDSDLVVGTSIYYGRDLSSAAFAWRNGAIQWYGDPTGARNFYATGVNNDGVIVGSYIVEESTGYSFTGGGFVIENGVVKDLDTLIAGSGWKMLSASAISGNGRIVGSARDAAGNVHSVMLNPVPEPASLAALGLGALAVMRRRRWK